MSYCIREDYTPRLNNDEADERGRQDQCQDEVYAYAKKLSKPGDHVLDVGTGGGFKLLKYFSEHPTVGTDIEPNLSWLKETYPNREWRESSFTSTEPGFDILICADVIEHLVNPDELLGFIKRSQPKLVIISTPNRDNLAEFSWVGPPRNLSHVREWSAPEFRTYLTRWFEVTDLVYPEAHRRDYSTMWAIAKIKEPENFPYEVVDAAK